MIVVTTGLFEAPLPAFLREHPFGLEPPFAREKHGVAGPFLVVGPPDTISNPDRHLGWLVRVALDADIDQLVGLRDK